MRFTKTVAVCSLILILSVALCIPAFAAAQPTSSVCDNAGLLSPAQHARIGEKIADADAYSGVRFVIYTRLGNGSEARAWYDRNYNTCLRELELERGSDFVLLLVSYSAGEYYYNIFTEGSADSGLSDYDIDGIYDEMLKIGKGNVEECISVFLDKASKCIAEANQPTPIYVIILISAAVGLIAAIVTGIIIYRKYKRKLKSPVYPLEKFASLTLMQSQDNFVDRIVTVTKRSSSSNNSASSRGGGGRHRGGGGRHRGGI